MNVAEAMKRLHAGDKITHKWFSPTEWMKKIGPDSWPKKEGCMLELEDGSQLTTWEFFKYRKHAEGWGEDWAIFRPLMTGEELSNSLWTLYTRAKVNQLSPKVFYIGPDYYKILRRDRNDILVDYIELRETYLFGIRLIVVNEAGYMDLSVILD